MFKMMHSLKSMHDLAAPASTLLLITILSLLLVAMV